MINNIILDKVASFKTSASLETDKKVNLIYGLNGTGKSTFSNYLYNSTNADYSNCSIQGLNNDEILVYNQRFIYDNFFEADNLKGIFTLSKTNKDAITKVATADKEIRRLEGERGTKEQEIEKENQNFSENYNHTKTALWEIKKNYTGGDRVLEYCLEGYKSNGDKLLEYIVKLDKPTVKPVKTTNSLKEEVQALAGDNAQKLTSLPQIVFSKSNIETNELLKKQIVGNENSTVAGLINKLRNSDWVKDGMQYLQEDVSEDQPCPFCQEKTISSKLVANIKDYFDESYENDIKSLKKILEEYTTALSGIPARTVYESNPKLAPSRSVFELKYNSLLKLLNDNLKKIEDKIKTPSASIELDDSSQVIKELSDIIKPINDSIDEHNKKIDNKAQALQEIKDSFWGIHRWEYDQTISAFKTRKVANDASLKKINEDIATINKDIAKQKAIIVEQQKQTVNIDEAIANVNAGLIDLGIDEFKIDKHSDSLYKIVRGDNREKIFNTLSEGEKMIISFLYFIELCRGKKSATDTGNNKIVVIDDPISSLSHIYVFNVGRLIKNEFLGKREKKNGIVNWIYKYEQVFILTHSLYFFYELTETVHDHRKESQNLFRLMKSDGNSNFQAMSYEEIKNDYQAYWHIVKDNTQHPALIANCMRNVIEYFFNFVENKDLNNFFQQSEMQNNRFQAFYRYMNRESHSLGQNIYDFKEFNYDEFKDAFATLFKVAGYEEHYKKMIK